ncbi:MAG: outer membrane protein assembly factor BamD [Bdellovibrionales bacterium]|nr:outer membrane protein assembly factor BamD [Oligoflexia bacterium]
MKFSSVFWIILAAQAAAYAQSESPHPGPRSDTQAQFLYDEGTTANTRKDYGLAIKDLEKFINRYPTHDKIQSAYLSLMEALFYEKKYKELLDHGRDFLNLKTDQESANRTRAYLAEANLNLHQSLDARLNADELLKHEPTLRQKALAYAVQFQAFLEDKQYKEAHNPLDSLISLLEKDPVEPFVKLMPEFKMTLAMRECATSHLLRNKEFSEDEITDYFTDKNLCYKSALPAVLGGVDQPTLVEWCGDFTYLNHELQKLKIDPFLKTKVQNELTATFDFSKTLSPELAKCYEPYKPPVKNKKRHRKRRVRKPGRS